MTNIRENISLKKYNTFGINANCDFFAEINSLKELKNLFKDIELNKIPKLVLGGGSNILFAVDYKGLIIKLLNKNIKKIEEEKEEADYIFIEADAGVIFNDLVKYTIDNNIWGLENLIDIPGEVGGAIVQNIGAYGVEIKNYVHSVEVFNTDTLKTETLSAQDCNFSYRDSFLKCKEGSKYIVWSVCFRLNKEAKPILNYGELKNTFKYKENLLCRDVAEFISNIRKSKLPEINTIGSAGSFFKNPIIDKNSFSIIKNSYPDIVYYNLENSTDIKISAAWLIEQCGWKAYVEGNVGVYEKQALILINYGNAAGNDIIDLATRIIKSVNEKFEIELSPEVIIIGDGGTDCTENKYKEVLDKMFKSLPMFQRIGAAAYKANLKTTLALMEELKHPYENFKTIHIAGTNGKGSTSHMIASVLQSAGYKTGLYTSPHLKDFRERIKINGEPITKEMVINFYETHEKFLTKKKASFFEMTVGMAFDYFSNEKVDVAIIEVGMGGRLDSTNVITPELSIITNISSDHTQFLGSTLSKIAEEKAGIIKNNVPIVIGESQVKTMNIFIRAAKEHNARITFADWVFNMTYVSNDNLLCGDIYKNGLIYLKALCCDLRGETYQTKNMITAICALDILNDKFNIWENAIKNGFSNIVENTGLRGRWQCLDKNPLIYCDIAHNEDGVNMILKQINKTNHKNLHIVWGMVGDKDIENILNLLPRSAQYYFCSPNSERALNVDDLQKAAAKKNLNGNTYKSIKSALNAAKENANEDDLIFIGGSTFVVAEIC